MERKIGEIFEYNGEWYQCIVGNGCWDCAFNKRKCSTVVDNGDLIGECCADRRKDNKEVIFKKLEKVGEMYEKRVSDGTSSTFQRYRVYNSVILPKEPYIYCNFIDSTIEIEIKQNKENMEEKKLNLKPFDIQKAREGKPVCTMDGRKARIICFDFRDVEEICCLIAAVDYGKAEKIYYYDSCGKYRGGDSSKHDLMMLPEKKEGWVNIYRSQIYNTPEKAKEAYKRTCNDDNYLQTIKIEWEE